MKLRIVRTDGENPRFENEYDSIMATSNRRYTIGEQTIGDVIDWLEDKLNVRKQHEYNNERYAELHDMFLAKEIALPIYMYDHSGITISTTPFSCKWDSAFIGYIYTPRENARKSWEVKRISPRIKAILMKNMKHEVEHLDSYIRGECYGFEILNDDDDVIESCYGFYGDDFNTNGIADYIDCDTLGITQETLTKLLATIEVSEC